MPDKAMPKPDKAMPKPDKAMPKPDKAMPKPDKGPTGPAVLYSSNFDTDNGKLKAWGDWQWGTLAFKAGPGCSTGIHPPPKAFSGTRVWGTILNDCYNGVGNAADPCKNQKTNDDSILRLEVMIPTKYKTAKLEYWEWNDYFLNFDWTEVRIGANILRQSCSGSYVAPTKWIKRTINLDSYVGKFVGIQFHFMATTVVNYSGWYVDDVTVIAQ